MIVPLITFAAVVATQALPSDSGHILVIRGEGDTTRYALDATIEVQVGETVELRPIVFDDDGTLIPVEALWWHNTSHGLVVFPELDESRVDGTGNESMRGEQIGTEQVMLHWPDGFWRITLAVRATDKQSSRDFRNSAEFRTVRGLAATAAGAFVGQG